MTDALEAGTGRFPRRTTAPGRARPGVGIVWLDRVSLVTGGGHPAFRTESVVTASAATRSGGSDTVGATVEVPPGYLVVDVRIGYTRAAAAFVAELRVTDLDGHGKSALVVLDAPGEIDGDERVGRSDGPAPVFVDARTGPTGERTFLTVRASVADGPDHVAVRNLRLNLTRV